MSTCINTAEDADPEEPNQMEENAATAGKLPIRGALAVFGAFLINIILGAYYSFGNIMPYLVAYMRERRNSTIIYR